MKNCAAVGTTSILSSLINLKMLGNASAQTIPVSGDYKALICVFLDGGNDSFNMLTPYEDIPYNEYNEVRGELALSHDELLSITDHDGTRYGLHPSMTAMKSLYDSDELAFIANVGALKQPTVKADLVGSLANAPLGLFSHSDQQMHWQTSTPEKRSSQGWGGRMADLLSSQNTRGNVAMNIALGGVNIYQNGQSSSPYTVTPNSLPTLTGYETDDVFRNAVDSLLEHDYQNLLRQSYADSTRRAIDTGMLYRDAIQSAPTLDTVFPNGTNDVELIAQTIASRELLGIKRQTFFLRIQGWDFHDSLIAGQNTQLTSVTQKLASLWAAIKEMGLENDVVIYTASDFGRSLTANGNGTDHAWGGNQFVIGGQVKGGRIYGEYPESLALGSELDMDPGRGRILPTTSTDEYFAELASWFGVSNSELSEVLPNLGRFYTVGSSTPPMGFLL